MVTNTSLSQVQQSKLSLQHDWLPQQACSSAALQPRAPEPDSNPLLACTACRISALGTNHVACTHTHTHQTASVHSRSSSRVEMVHTRVRPWTETFRGKGTVGLSLCLSRPPSSAEQTASPDTNTARIKSCTAFLCFTGYGIIYFNAL